MNIGWYDRIKYFYDNDMWSFDDVKSAVGYKKITAEQFKTITGKDYIEMKTL